MVASALTHDLTPKQIRFLRCFEACASVTQAARWAKIQRQTHYLWLDSPLYANAFAKAEKVAGRTLEDEAVRRAHEGLRKAVRYKGRIVGYETEFSDSLMALLLKGAMPKKYGTTNTALEVSGPDGGPIQLTAVRERLEAAVANLPEEMRIAIAERMMLDAGK